jgi:hypothetical protein
VSGEEPPEVARTDAEASAKRSTELWSSALPGSSARRVALRWFPTTPETRGLRSAAPTRRKPAAPLRQLSRGERYSPETFAGQMERQ